MKRTFLYGIIGLMAASPFVSANEPKETAFIHHKCKALATHATPKIAHKQGSPFLIAHGLPHLTKKIKAMWHDPALGLSEEQKAKLLKVRQTTMRDIKRLKPQIMQLRRFVVEGSKAGKSAEALAKQVDELAKLKAEATKVQLRCIEQTKAILTKDQLFYLLSSKAKKPMLKMPKATAKCAHGKCGSAK